MRRLRSSRWLFVTVFALAVAIGGTGLWFQTAARSSHATSTTEVFLTPSGQVNPATIVGFVGGPSELVDVRVDKLDFASGLGSFEFTITFNSEVASVLGVTEGPFLASTGRDTNCTTPVISATQVNFSCNSLGSSPDGPTGSGVLATIEVLPAATFGSKTSTALTFEKSHLTDISGDVLISHTPTNGSMLITKCGDFNTDKIITIGDMVLIIGRFGDNATETPDWDPAFDLNDDGAITITDLLLEAQQFGRQCNA